VQNNSGVLCSVFCDSVHAPLTSNTSDNCSFCVIVSASLKIAQCHVLQRINSLFIRPQSSSHVVPKEHSVR